MRLAIILALSLLVVQFAYAENSTSDLVKADLSSNVEKKLADLSRKTADCAKEFECRVADYSERSFWFGCYSDNGTCRCYKGDFSDCNVDASSITMDYWCALQYECVGAGDGLYQFGCYFDGQCKCFVGDLEQCDGERSFVNKSALLSARQLKKTELKINDSPGNASTVSQQARSSSGFSFSPLMLAGIGFFLAVVGLVSFVFLRSGAEDSLEKARRFHRKAEELHDAGNEEEAHKYYRLAEDYRIKSRGS
ncbi:hypothetical protein HYU11_02585 [Candidatus Woesearchaeota archaeon]|nr:hypothetical protein [Candidatus Woesearchaeota archaeon]